jgi:hypothetical protein
MSLSAHSSLSEKIAFWAERLNDNLFWIAFYQKGQIQQVIYNPSREPGILGTRSLLATLSEMASKLSSELCSGRFSQVIIVMDCVQYVCLCRANRPYAVMALDGTAKTENFWSE